MACKHKNFDHDVKCQWMEVKCDGKTYREAVMLLKVSCTDCGEPYTFKGNVGWNTTSATVSADGKEMRIPVKMPPIEKTSDDDEVGPN